jgi:hypothetical protein
MLQLDEKPGNICRHIGCARPIGMILFGGSRLPLIFNKIYDYFSKKQVVPIRLLWMTQ